MRCKKSKASTCSVGNAGTSECVRGNPVAGVRGGVREIAGTSNQYSSKRWCSNGSHASSCKAGAARRTSRAACSRQGKAAHVCSVVVLRCERPVRRCVAAPSTLKSNLGTVQVVVRNKRVRCPTSVPCGSGGKTGRTAEMSQNPKRQKNKTTTELWY